jgi:hypothetical protein
MHLADAGRAGEAALDLANLDAIAAIFHLAVEAAEKLHHRRAA